MMTKNSFGNWILPLSLKNFEEQYLHQKLFHASSLKHQGLMTWEGLNGLLNQSGLWSAETLKLYRHAHPVAPEEYCVSSLNSQGHPLLRPHPPLVQKWISRGASLVLNDIDELTLPLREMSHNLKNLFGARVQANLYTSRQGIQAFSSHFDLHDVFVFQCEGEKTWHIYKNRVDAPFNHPTFNLLSQDHHEHAKGPLLKKVTLKAGDFLYLPRGFYHDALASKAPSLHVTFGVTRPIGLDIISLLFEEGVDHALLRQYLTPSSVAAQCQKLADHLSNRLKQPDFLQKIHSLFNEEETFSPYTLPDIKQTALFKVRGKGFSVEHHSHQFWLASATSEAPIPKGKEKLVEWILLHQEITLEEMIQSPLNTSKQEWETLANDLLQMGILE
jgi:hypothetical protein